MTDYPKTEAGLKAWVDESILASRAKGYHPTEFIKMLERYGTIPAIERLVISGEMQTGFRKLLQLGILHEWSMEAGVLKFPNLFTKKAQQSAEFRLRFVNDKALRQ